MMRSFSGRPLAVVLVAFNFGTLFLFVLSYGKGLDEPKPELVPETAAGVARRLLGGGMVGERAAAAMAAEERMAESGCSRDDVAVYQGATAPLPNGIPTYTVEILNVCESGCAVAELHVSCGWFSSARLINPRVFRRVRFDDCLVNDGAALAPGQSLSFQYANTYPYPLYVSSLSCQ